MKHRLSLLIALGGCSLLFIKGPHVPSAYQGTTEITVANAWNRPMCAFSITEHNDGQFENWLGEGMKRKSIAPGGHRTFAIKSGVYHVVAGFCDDAGQVVAASGTYGNATKTIDGATLIALGPNPVDPVANATTLAFPKLFTPQAGGGGGGGGEPAAAAEPAAEAAPASTTSASSSEPAAPAGPQCLSHGAVCADAQPCCAGMTCASRTKYSDGTFGNGYCQ